MLLSRLQVSNEVLNKIVPSVIKYECSIPVDGHSPNTVRTVTKVSCALDKLL